eukprot:gene26112-31530_t
MECIVCGKLFARGPLDLARHINAVTLQHFATKKSKGGFNFHCSRCGYFFQQEDHLNLHGQFSACARGVPLAQSESAVQKRNASRLNERLNGKSVSDLGSNQSQEPPVKHQRLLRGGCMSSEGDDGMDVDVDEADNGSDSDHNSTINSSDQDSNENSMNVSIRLSIDSSNLDGEEVKTLECMVCGKLFPRGPVDLARHATAVTLRHLVSSRSSAAYPYPCNSCSLHFTCAEHLEMHQKQSTCNPDNTWPSRISNLTGLHVVPRSEADKVVEKTRYHKHARKASAGGVGAGKKGYSGGSTATPTAGSGWGGKRKKIREQGQDDGGKEGSVEEFDDDANSDHPTSAPRHLLTATTCAFHLPALYAPGMLMELSCEELTGGTSGTPAAAVESAGIVTAEMMQTRHRRSLSRVLLPEDRRAYFSLVSLLVDRNLLKQCNKDAYVQLTEENVETYVEQKHLPLLRKLKE